MAEKTGKVTFKGEPLTLIGDGDVAVGQSVPDAVLSKNPKEDCKISDFKGKTLVINVVPSLDTPVCSIQTARFNKEASSLGESVVILTVSRDLPPAQARWCQANSATNIKTASDYKHRDFGTKFGLEMKELGLLARSVFVVDAAGKVVYAELVPEVTQEPNYDAALAAVKSLH